MSTECPICGEYKHRQSKTCRNCFFLKQSSPESRAKMSEQRTGKPSYVRTPEQRKRMSEIQKAKIKPTGWNHSEETKKKMASLWTDEKREAARQRGKKFAQDPEWRKKVSSYGEDNPRWKDGCATKPYAPGFDRKMKQSIRERDDFTCQLCGITEEETGCPHSIHHIDYTKDNHHPDNLATTCKACNSRVNTNESVWYGYFVVLAEYRSQLGKDIVKFIGRKVITQNEGFVLIDRV